MFGYVKPVKADLLVKEYEFYKATYCGICRSMKSHTGALSPVTLTYDSVFLALVRMAFIPDSELKAKMSRCLAHPLKKRCMLVDNPAIQYTAEVFAVLTYYKLLDDTKDEKLLRRIGTGLVKPVSKRAVKLAKNPELEAIVRDRLSRIDELEKAGCQSVDKPAALFGELLGEMFAGGLSGSDRLVAYSCGYHLGKFIYAADAAEDYDEDKRLGRYNPYVLSYEGKELTEENRESIRCALILECRELEGAINLIPFGKKYTIESIIRNIIYEGLIKRIDFLSGKSGDKAPDEKGML